MQASVARERESKVSRARALEKRRSGKLSHPVPSDCSGIKQEERLCLFFQFEGEGNGELTNDACAFAAASRECVLDLGAVTAA